MPLKIVVASDSWKGSLPSLKVADALAIGINGVIPDAEIVKVTIADGGEGTLLTLLKALEAHLIAINVKGPLGDTVTAHYGIAGHTAIIEIAQAAGLELVPTDCRNPMNTTTYGVGQIISDALDRGCRNILMCIGGSCTNDGGIGMLQALGALITDCHGQQLPGTGASLTAIDRIDLTGLDPRLAHCTIDVACDVDNPLYGTNGAAHVFARQKGADNLMIKQLDAGLHNYGDKLRSLTGHDIAAMPGAGAAGGLGAALAGILHANLKPGIDLVLNAVKFDHLIQDADLIITGEGHIDSQTLNGKAPFGVLLHGKSAHIPVIAVAGQADDTPTLLKAGFTAILTTYDPSLDLAHNIDPENTIRHLINIASKIALKLEQSQHIHQ